MINPSSMRVVDVARLLNSTALGFAIPQARLYRDFNRVGFRISASDNSRNINLIKYISYLYDRKHSATDGTGARSYDERRDAERARQAEQSLTGRDPGAVARTLRLTLLSPAIVHRIITNNIP